MRLIELLNLFGRHSGLRPLGWLLLRLATAIHFSKLVGIAGRRLVSASAGAPAVLLTQSTIKDAVKDPKLLYTAVRYTVEKMRFDTLCLFVDMSLEAEACGCQIQLNDSQLPIVVTHPIKTIEDVAKLRVPDPYRDGRMPVFLEAMRLMKKHFSMMKAGEIIGPFTLATHLSGTEIYLDVRKNPQKVLATLEYCKRVIISYGRALIRSGADMIIIAEPNGSLLSPSQYEEFSLAWTKEIIESLNNPCILHICGKAGHIIEKMCQSGAVALSIDEVDIAQVIKSVPQSIVIIGNINPSKFSICSPEEINSLTVKLLEEVKYRKQFIIAPGCDLPPQTSMANILSFVETVKHYRQL